MRSALLRAGVIGLVVLVVAAAAEAAPWLLGLCVLVAIGITIRLALRLILDAGGLPGDY